MRLRSTLLQTQVQPNRNSSFELQQMNQPSQFVESALQESAQDRRKQALIKQMNHYEKQKIIFHAVIRMNKEIAARSCLQKFLRFLCSEDESSLFQMCLEEQLDKQNYIKNMLILEKNQELAQRKENIVRLQQQKKQLQLLNFQQKQGEESLKTQLLSCKNDLCFYTIHNRQMEENLNEYKRREQMIKKEVMDSCVVCYNNKAEYVNKECGHLTLCEKCVRQNICRNRCVICRKPGGYVKIHSTALNQFYRLF